VRGAGTWYSCQRRRGPLGFGFLEINNVADTIPIMASSDESRLGVLVGRKIVAVQLHRWGGWFILGDEGSRIKIQFDSGLLFTGADGNTTELADMRTGGGSICSLLGLAIEGVEGKSPDPKYKDYQLVLNIESGIRLEILCCAFVEVDGSTIFPTH
jgi:hypothetical protein